MKMAKGITRKIKIKVLNLRNRNTITFLMSVNWPFKKLMRAYSEKTGYDLVSLRFLWCYDTLDEDSTPESLGLEDEAVIECYNY